MSQRWSTAEDVVTALRRRWDRGDLLRQVAGGEEWQPIRIPLRGPTAREVGEQLGAVQDWVQALRRAGFRLETRRVGGRLVGSNEIPAAAWFDTAEQAWAALRVTRVVAAYGQLLDVATAADPGLGDWVSQHPMRALRHRDRAGTGVYLRQVDVPGVDTKFIEQREGLLAELLDAVGGGRPEGGSGRRLEARYGFLGKPDRLRLRSLGGGGLIPESPLSDLTVRVDELTGLEVPCHTVLVVENEVTFLALPPLPGVVAVFGAGFDVLRLSRVPWLRDARILYWGDIDTHGFVILDRLRATVPHTESVLMDPGTLLAHREQWVSEPRPSREHLERLTSDEAEVYADLVGDVHGAAVRLEQERVNYAYAVAELRARTPTACA